MKSFFIHRCHNPGKIPHSVSRGFTAHIKQNPLDDTSVLVSVSFCNPKDEFNKKIGREQAMQGTYEPFNKKDVPTILAACNHTMWKHTATEASEFYYVYKYMF